MKDREAIERELDEHDFQLLRILADLSLDEGDEDSAAGYLWLAEWKKVPQIHLVRLEEKWGWTWDSSTHQNYRRSLPVYTPTGATKSEAYRLAARIVGAWYRKSTAALIAEAKEKASN